MQKVSLKKNTKHDEKISVIVPVYNVEKYLNECIESIIKQTYKNLQIILIDDGSTDNSGTICRNFANKDNRIEVYHLKQAGVSAARNYGIDCVKGEFIFFVDSDDILNENIIRNLYNNINECDIAYCHSWIFSDFNEIKAINYNSKFDSREVTASEFIESMFRDCKTGKMNNEYRGHVWDKLFRTEIIKENNIKFDEEIYFNEDRMFIFDYLLNCKKVKILNWIGYYYRIRKDSAMNDKKLTNKQFTEFEAFNKMLQKVETNNNLKNQIKLDICLSSSERYLCFKKYVQAKEFLNLFNKYKLKLLFDYRIGFFAKLRIIKKQIKICLYNNR